jgi:flagellar hook-associated protein FlgK
MIVEEIIKTQNEEIELLKERVKTEQELTQVYKEINTEMKQQIEKLFKLLDEAIEINKQLTKK